MKKPKIAIVISHPIQHFCPQYVSYAKCDEWEIKVFFATALGYKEYYSPGFDTSVIWKDLGIEKFPHTFLNNGKVIMTSKSLDAPELDDHLADFDPDVLIVYGYWQKYQKRALRWGYRSNKKILYISDSELRQKRNFFLQQIKFFYLRKYFRKIDAFLTVGNANEDFYIKYGADPAKFFRTPFPIDIESYKKNYSQKETIRMEVRNLLRIEEDEVVCSVVGTLVSWKRQGDIIDALGQLENSNYKFTLLIIGSGTMLETLQAKAKIIKKNRVIFTKFVDAHALPKYYAASDIYIHPSDKEPHALAISEAIYMGCPVILSDKCGSYGPTDDVQPEKNGFIYECGNIAQLASKMEILAANAELRKRFGEYSHSFALQSQVTSHYGGLKAALSALNIIV